MDKQEVLLLAQLIKTLQNVVNELEKAEQEVNIERFEHLKREALDIQKKIDQSL